jgi:hypothetical protein
MATTGGSFPFGLRGEAGTAPFAEGSRIIPADLDNRMITTIRNIALRTFRVSPIRPLDLTPPRGGRNTASERKVIGEQAPEHERVTEQLCCRPVAGCFDEAVELVVSYRELRDLKGMELDLMDRSFPVIWVPERIVGSHQE